ncbi:MAG: DUF2281 domain-containing protein [Chloroflexi bacterium]|nr:DUF2281 domain-containing protein [Chloroflexota bacterium]
MSRKEMILKEMEEVPDPLLEQVVDYIRFLKLKMAREKFELPLLSESSLKKDWLRPEEDEAWQDL